MTLLESTAMIIPIFRVVNKRRPPTKWSATLQLWSATFLWQGLV